MRTTPWCALALAGCMAELPIEETGRPDPSDTGGPATMVMEFRVDCADLPPPEIDEISALPVFERLHRVDAPFEGYVYRENRPPLDALMRVRLSDAFLAWAHKSGAKVDREPERTTREIYYDDQGHPLAPCEYLATCKAQPCGEDDLWNPDGTPRYKKLVGWIHAPIELTVWER